MDSQIILPQMLLAQISYLSEVNAADGEIDTYALGDEAEVNLRAKNLDERFFTLQMALTGNLLEAVSHANRTIGFNLNIHKLVWFYSGEMYPDYDFWKQKYNEQGAVLRFAFDCASSGKEFSKQLINSLIENCNQGKVTLTDEWHKALKVHRDNFVQQGSLLLDYTEAYAALNERIKRDDPHYTEAERPPVDDDPDLEGSFVLGQIFSGGVAKNAAKANIDAAKTLLVRASFIEKQVIPAQSENAVQFRQNIVGMRKSVNGLLGRASEWMGIHQTAINFRFPD